MSDFRSDLTQRLYRELLRRGLDVYLEMPLAALPAECARMGLPALARADLTQGELRAWLDAHEGEELPTRVPCTACSHPLAIHHRGVGCLACRCAAGPEAAA